MHSTLPIFVRMRNLHEEGREVIWIKVYTDNVQTDRCNTGVFKVRYMLDTYMRNIFILSVGNNPVLLHLKSI